MPTTPRCIPVRKDDPAGLDNLLLALGKAAHDFMQRKAAVYGISMDWWTGEEGLEAALQSVIKEHGIPNQRFQELVTPRGLMERAGVVKPRKRRLAR